MNKTYFYLDFGKFQVQLKEIIKLIINKTLPKSESENLILNNFINKELKRKENNSSFNLLRILAKQYDDIYQNETFRNSGKYTYTNLWVCGDLLSPGKLVILKLVENVFFFFKYKNLSFVQINLLPNYSRNRSTINHNNNARYTRTKTKYRSGFRDRLLKPNSKTVINNLARRYYCSCNGKNDLNPKIQEFRENRDKYPPLCSFPNCRKKSKKQKPKTLFGWLCSMIGCGQKKTTLNCCAYKCKGVKTPPPASPKEKKKSGEKKSSKLVATSAECSDIKQTESKTKSGIKKCENKEKIPCVDKKPSDSKNNKAALNKLSDLCRKYNIEDVWVSDKATSDDCEKNKSIPCIEQTKVKECEKETKGTCKPCVPNKRKTELQDKNKSKSELKICGPTPCVYQKPKCSSKPPDDSACKKQPKMSCKSIIQSRKSEEKKPPPCVEQQPKKSDCSGDKLPPMSCKCITQSRESEKNKPKKPPCVEEKPKKSNFSCNEPTQISSKKIIIQLCESEKKKPSPHAEQKSSKCDSSRKIPPKMSCKSNFKSSKTEEKTCKEIKSFPCVELNLKTTQIASMSLASTNSSNKGQPQMYSTTYNNKSQDKSGSSHLGMKLYTEKGNPSMNITKFDHQPQKLLCDGTSPNLQILPSVGTSPNLQILPIDGTSPHLQTLPSVGTSPHSQKHSCDSTSPNLQEFLPVGTSPNLQKLPFDGTSSHPQKYPCDGTSPNLQKLLHSERTVYKPKQTEFMAETTPKESPNTQESDKLPIINCEIDVTDYVTKATEKLHKEKLGKSEEGDKEYQLSSTLSESDNKTPSELVLPKNHRGFETNNPTISKFSTIKKSFSSECKPQTISLADNNVNQEAESKEEKDENNLLSINTLEEKKVINEIVKMLAAKIPNKVKINEKEPLTSLGSLKIQFEIDFKKDDYLQVKHAQWITNDTPLSTEIGHQKDTKSQIHDPIGNSKWPTNLEQSGDINTNEGENGLRLQKIKQATQKKENCNAREFMDSKTTASPLHKLKPSGDENTKISNNTRKMDKDIKTKSLLQSKQKPKETLKYKDEKLYYISSALIENYPKSDITDYKSSFKKLDDDLKYKASPKIKSPVVQQEYRDNELHEKLYTNLINDDRLYNDMISLIPRKNSKINLEQHDENRMPHDESDLLNNFVKIAKFGKMLNENTKETPERIVECRTTQNMEEEISIKSSQDEDNELNSDDEIEVDGNEKLKMDTPKTLETEKYDEDYTPQTSEKIQKDLRELKEIQAMSSKTQEFCKIMLDIVKLFSANKCNPDELSREQSMANLKMKQQKLESLQNTVTSLQGNLHDFIKLSVNKEMEKLINKTTDNENNHKPDLNNCEESIYDTRNEETENKLNWNELGVNDDLINEKKENCDNLEDNRTNNVIKNTMDDTKDILPAIAILSAKDEEFRKTLYELIYLLTPDLFNRKKDRSSPNGVKRKHPS